MILYIHFIVFNLIMIVQSRNIQIHCGLNEPPPHSVGLTFFADVTNLLNERCTVEVFPDECCLDTNDKDCKIIELFDGTKDEVEAGATKRLTMVAPLLYPIDRKGYCSFYIDSRPLTRPKHIIRDTIKIKFDTKFTANNTNEDIKVCSHVDQDPFNDCKPVDCDTYYNGKKSYYSVVMKRCVSIPPCFARDKDTSYNPISNKCVDKPLVTKDDIEYIKHISNLKSRKGEEMLLKTTHNDKMISIDIPLRTTQSLYESDSGDEELQNHLKSKPHHDIYKLGPYKSSTTFKLTTQKPIHYNTKTTNITTLAKFKCIYRKFSRHPILRSIWRQIHDNKYVTLTLICITMLQCCLLVGIIQFTNKACACFKRERPAMHRVLNYRQDASVTTPLIATSNIDTETTECQYPNESLNYIDKKIKCYKACQRERKNNTKISMSDDILSKCIARRDWSRIPRSAIIQEDMHSGEEIIVPRRSEAKVNFEDERPKIVTKSFTDLQRESTEREICCHSYNYTQNSFMGGLRHYTTQMPVTDKIDKSIDQSAQAYFSNDTIDDFLSERGVIFMGENASKYSFTSLSSVEKSPSSPPSSKTSKDNIVQNVMSLLKRKSKGPAADPGVKKPKNALDLELLHISRATVFSSESESKDSKRSKTSISSLQF